MALNYIYRLYFKQGTTGVGVHRSFLLLAPAVTAIFLVIQFSLPLSLGLLGALSFVRFRTPIKEPEEIGFILVVIANSLACAVYKFEVSLILTVLLFAVAILRSKNDFVGRLFSKEIKCELFIVAKEDTVEDATLLTKISDLIEGAVSESKLLSISNAEGQTSYHFTLNEKGKSGTVLAPLLAKLKHLSAVSNVNLIYDEA